VRRGQEAVTAPSSGKDIRDMMGKNDEGLLRKVEQTASKSNKAEDIESIESSENKPSDGYMAARIANLLEGWIFQLQRKR
jgi:hypothetical protein